MQKQSSRVFVCYRRDDSRWQANLLADELAARFGQTAVFMDVDNVRPGDWRRQVDASLADCAAVIVVIGPRWLAEFSRRTAGEDQVRYEIAQALKRGKVIVPVTVDHAEIPDRASLPEDIAALSDAQGYELGVDVMWRPTVGKLLDDLSGFLAGHPGADLHGNGSVAAVDAVHAATVPEHPVRPHEPVSGPGHSRFGQPLLVGLAVLAVVLIGLLAWRVLAPPAPVIPPTTPPTSGTAPGAGSPAKPVARGTVVGTCDEGGTCGVRLRTGPDDDAPTFTPGELLKDGAAVQIVCQTIGDKRTNTGQVSTDYWYQLESGAFISAVYVTIEASGRIPDCRP